MADIENGVGNAGGVDVAAQVDGATAHGELTVKRHGIVGIELDGRQIKGAAAHTQPGNGTQRAAGCCTHHQGTAVDVYCPGTEAAIGRDFQGAGIYRGAASVGIVRFQLGRGGGVAELQGGITHEGSAGIHLQSAAAHLDEGGFQAGAVLHMKRAACYFEGAVAFRHGAGIIAQGAGADLVILQHRR